MGGFRIWRRSAITELQKTKTTTEAGGQVGMEWSSTKKKFEMDETKGLVVMIEKGPWKEVEALENEIGSENVRHATEIMGRGEERMEASHVKYTNGRAEGGSDGRALKIFLTYPDYVSTCHSPSVSGMSQQVHKARRKNHFSQQESIAGWRFTVSSCPHCSR